MHTIEINGLKYIKEDKVASPYEKGEFVIVRTYAAGVHMGYILVNDRQNKIVTLTEGRRIWKWEGAFTLSELATYGSKNPDECRISTRVSKIDLPYIELIYPSQEIVTILDSMLDDKKWRE